MRLAPGERRPDNHRRRGGRLWHGSRAHLSSHSRHLIAEMSAHTFSKETAMTRFPRALIAALALSISIALGTGPASAKSAAEIDAEANQALETLYKESSAAKELGAKASGILVFPSITKGGFIVGGEYGEGVLRVDGESQGYYSSASGSVGLQLGISSRSLVIMFMTKEALKDFTDADGWEAGVNADVTVVDIGATGSLDTTTAQNPVIAFNFGEEGLMAGVSVEGTKVSKLDP
jgi:lipid-binding SYLF domain-containing protein